MSSTSFPLIAIMITGLLVTAGIASVVLFIVGLVKRRAAIWATGLVLGVVVVVMMVVGGAMFFMASAVSVTAAPGSTPTTPTLVTASPISTFEECTGLPLPSGAGVRSGMTSSNSGSGGSTKECALVLTVPADFGAFLDANFKKATPQEASAALTGPKAPKHGMWAAKDVQGLVYYTLTRSGGDAGGAEATQTWTTTIAYDARTGRAYVVGVRKDAGK